MKKAARNQKIGDYRLRNVLEAFDAESRALTKIYMTVSKEIGKLQMEEQLLEQMLQRAEQRHQQEQAEEALALEAALEAAFEADGAEGGKAEGGEAAAAGSIRTQGEEGSGPGADEEGGGAAAGADCTSTAPGLQNKQSEDESSQQS